MDEIIDFLTGGHSADTPLNNLNLQTARMLMRPAMLNRSLNMFPGSSVESG